MVADSPIIKSRSERSSPLLRNAGRAVAWAFRLIPRRLRFRAARLLARLAEPLVRKTRVYRERILHRTDDLREISLDMVLLTLSRHGTEFDPIMDVRGAEVLEDVAGRPALLISTHMMLGTLILRYLDDRGQAPHVITTDAEARIPGRRKLARVMHAPSPTLLMRARQTFRKGEMICTAIDRGSLVSADGERRTVPIEVNGGTMIVSDAMVRLAVRHHARIIFLSSQMDSRRNVVLRLSAPPTGAGVNEILESFAVFMREAAARTTLDRPA